MPNYHIHLHALLTGLTDGHEEAFVRRICERARRPIEYREAFMSDDLAAAKTFILQDGNHRFRLAVSNRPLPRDKTELLCLSSDLTASDLAAVVDHTNFISLDYLDSRNGKPGPCETAAITLLAMLAADETIGYASISGLFYRPKEKTASLLDKSHLTGAEMYLLLVNCHCVDEAGTYWLHTHGMEQFGLPDLQMRFHDSHRQEYFWMLLGDTSLYMIENGPIISAGNTGELMGDGQVYRFLAAPKDPNHEFGAFGCLEIVPI